jgi:myosin heavy subunit
MRRKFSRRRVVQLEMVQKIQKNARIFVALSGWAWWRLYSKVKPLTSITRMDEELKDKAETIHELEARLKGKELEYEKCTMLNHNLDQEKADLLNQLDAERQTAEDNSEILLRAQEKLSLTLEELQDVTNELRGCEADLENIRNAKEVDDKVMEDLLCSIQEKEQHIDSLSSLQQQHLQQISTLSTQITEEETRILNLTEKLQSLEEEYVSSQECLQNKEAELMTTAVELENSRAENHRLNQTMIENASAAQRKVESMTEEYKVSFLIRID